MTFSIKRIRRRGKVPVILQAEAAECASACLGMVAAFWGRYEELATLRRRYVTSLKGVTLEAVLRIAERMDMSARPLRIEIAHLGRLALPAILHWDMAHFVVLVKVDRSGVVVHDPAVGRCHLSMAEISRHFTGIALEVAPSASFRAGDHRGQLPLKNAIGVIGRFRPAFLSLLMLAVASQVLALLAPAYLRWVVDEAVATRNRDALLVFALVFLVLLAIHGAVLWLRGWLVAALAVRLKFQWLTDVFGHLVRLKLEYFENRHTGDIISRFSSIHTLQRSVTTQVIEGAIDGVLAICALALMAAFSVWLAGLSVLFLAAYVAFRILLYRDQREASNEQIVSAAQHNSHLIETVRGMQSIRLFNRERTRQQAWTSLLVDNFRAEHRAARLTVVQQIGATMVFGTERILLIYFGAHLVLEGRASLGAMLALLAYREQFHGAVLSLTDKIFDLRMLAIHLERLADIIEADPERRGPLEALQLQPNDKIRFCDVSFRYGEGEPWVLSGVNLEIEVGECVAIVGASGSGKTTLVKLLLGLLTPTSGRLEIAGRNLQDIDPLAYRSLIGTVMQDDRLFAGTIGENISFFASPSDASRVTECSRLAAIDKEIEAMPMKYNTLVGDLGVGISGGQRQRIMLARALYSSPQLLILDEATSSLDVRNESLVNDAVNSLKLTRVVIAHRRETIEMADRIITLAGGRVVAERTRQSSNAVETDS